MVFQYIDAKFFHFHIVFRYRLLKFALHYIRLCVSHIKMIGNFNELIENVPIQATNI